MNPVMFPVLGMAVLLTVSACSASSVNPGPEDAGRPASPEDALVTTRAQPGDTVYLVEHYVRPDRRQDFEDFVYTVLWPAMQRSAALNEGRRRVQQQTRLLLPVTANPDSSLTYAFVLDPVVQGVTYSVLDLLREAYPEAEALQHYARFTETWARDFSSRPFVQAR